MTLLKSILSSVALTVLLTFCAPANLWAQYVDGGTTGPLTWQLTGTVPNYTLTISGNGDMPDYDWMEPCGPNTPWCSYRQNITALVIEYGVLSIGQMAFWDCSKLTSVSLPNSLTSIGDWAFYGCYEKLTSIVLPNSLTSIGDEAFFACFQLTSITFPSNLTSIGNAAFGCCKNLKTVNYNAVNCVCNFPFNSTSLCSSSQTTRVSTLNIGSMVKNISGTISFNPLNDFSITTEAITPPTKGSGVMLPKTAPVYVPCGSYDTYLNAPGWGDYFTNFYFSVADKQQLCMISVDKNNHNEIVWKKQEEVPSYKMTFYNIYREGIQSGQYDLLATVDYTEPNKWVDLESNAKTRSYRYKVSAVGSCENESVLSDAHKTMHLTINAGINNSWNLIWTAYEGTEYATYNIYRSTGDSIGEMQLIGTMPAGNTSFSDFSAPQGYVYYMVEIMLNETCKIGKAGSSIKSNIATNNPNVGIETITNDELRFTIYPNPTTGELTISFAELAPTGAAVDNVQLTINNVEIFDVYGRKVWAKFPSNALEGWQPQADGVVINISHLQTGLYFVKIQTEAGNVVKKVVKE